MPSDAQSARIPELSPAWRLAGWIAGLFGIVLWPRPVEVAIVGGICVLGLLISSGGRRIIRRRLGVALPWIVLALGAWALQERHLPISSSQRLMLALRVTVGSLFSGAMARGLRSGELRRGLQELRLPRSFVELLLETRALGRSLTETLTSALCASTLRGSGASLRTRARAAGTVAGVVLVRCLDRADRRVTALALRGYGMARVSGNANAEPSVDTTAGNAIEQMRRA
ncbi:MAG TPA: energy-coupling factor transporter transmembrane component T [Polyangiaceae bacterium]|nr:energy-coupling factor transporter transmembrane component T [Polyangiaceae bacterium]